MSANSSEELKYLLPTVYKDVAQPSLQKIGTALSSLVGLITTPVTKASQISEKNIVRLISKFEKVDSTDVQPVPPELGVPILEKLRYTRGEELVNLYTELFLKASVKGESSVHPSYFEIITNLSVDEARILEHLKRTDEVNIPYIRVKGALKDEAGDIIILKYFTSLPLSVNFTDLGNVQMYLENLTRLGLLHDFDTRYLINEDTYKPIYELLDAGETKKKIENRGRTMKIEKSYFVLTDFGEKFIDICLPPFN